MDQKLSFDEWRDQFASDPNDINGNPRILHEEYQAYLISLREPVIGVHIAYPSIEQYRSAIREVKHRAQYVRTEDDGTIVMDRLAVAPKLMYHGTVKLHGTNASVAQSEVDNTRWYQSRNNIIAVGSDNAGFAGYATSVSPAFDKIFAEIKEKSPVSYDVAIVYGEWCGAGIQSGVALAQIGKKIFVVFNIKVGKRTEDENYTMWLPDDLVHDIIGTKYEDSNIYSIGSFDHYEMEIDFNEPELYQNKLVEITEAIEKECPAGKYFGVSGIGEGDFEVTREGNNIICDAKFPINIEKDVINFLLNNIDDGETTTINILKDTG